MKRGVVSSPCELIPVRDGVAFQVGKEFSQVDINYFTLYWDNLVVPTNNVFHKMLPNENDLIDCGFLLRPEFQVRSMTSRELPAFQLSSQMETIDTLRKQENSVDWRLNFIGNQVVIPSEEAISKQIIRFELGRLLPVPPRDVHLNEILEFKERRADELAALHDYLDQVYFEIIESADINLQKAKSFSALAGVISDINKLNDEGWRSPIKLDISTSFEFDVGQVYSAATTAMLAANSANPMDAVSLGTAITILGGFVKLTPGLQQMRRGGDKNLAYLTNARDVGLITSKK